MSAYDGHLRTFNDILALSANKEVALARQEAESASITAKGFESQIEESKARVKTAEAQIASANAASKDAVAKVAAADARIAEANRAAQEAQKETVRLEAQIQPRRLTTAQQNILSFRCAHFIGKKVAVETYSLDVESVILARQIMSALRNIGIVVEDNSMSIIPARGLSLGIHVYGRDKGLVNVLVIAFRSLNLAAVANASPPNEAIMRSGGNGDAAVTILVGVKPPPAE